MDLLILLRSDVSLYLLAALQTLPLLAVLSGFSFKLAGVFSGA